MRSTRATKRKSSVSEEQESPPEEHQQPLSANTEEPQKKKFNRRSVRSVPDEVEEEMKEEVDVLVKMEPRVEGEELMENEYHPQLDPLVLRAETELWCDCPAEGGGEAACETDCENRARRVECSECPAGARCSNRALQTLGSPPLTFSGGNLTAATRLEAGALVAQYTGEVMSRETFTSRLEQEYAQQDSSLYVFPLTEELVVDATSKGSVIRFAGHSCSPNAEISVWKVTGLDCLAVTAKREIQAGETVSLDLSPAMKILGSSKRCGCGAGNCRILLGSSAITRGPERCGACLHPLLEAGKVGKVLLHPQLATPVCQGCYERHQEQDWDQVGLCSWCCHQGERSLLSCVSCPRAFCRKCLQQNLGLNYIKLATTGSWSCLLCNPEPLANIRQPLWLEGEQERQPVKSGPGRTAASPAVRPAVRTIRPPAAIRSPAPRSLAAMRSPAPRGTSPLAPPRGSSPGVRGARPATPRQATRLVRPARPGTPRVRMPPPAGPGRVAAPFPVRMLGSSNVSIERVPRPPPPVPAQRTPETASIISQLQRYSGLSIQPVSQSTSSLESACSHLESLQRSIQAAASQSRKALKTDVPGAKKQIQEVLKLSKSKISEIESLL